MIIGFLYSKKDIDIYQKDIEALDKTMKAIIDYNFIAILTAGFTIFQSKRGWLNSSATV